MSGNNSTPSNGWVHLNVGGKTQDQKQMTSRIDREYEAQYFGFSTRGFVNFYYNEFVVAWPNIVENEILPAIVKHDDSKQNVQDLRTKLFDRLFQRDKFDLILSQFQKYANEYIFVIPKHVTLPEDLANLKLDEYDEPELWDRIKKLQSDILKLKYEIAHLDVLEHNTTMLISVKKTVNEANKLSIS
ncbi:hypothetical protein Ddc_14706 [Ditylenchus destructor]|nr:hypothetical protein Ddc_14706 [Ditylenchus destructor]